MILAHGLKGFSLHCFEPVKGKWIIVRHLAKAAHSKEARKQRKVSKWLGTQDHPHEHTLQCSNFLVLSSGAHILKFSIHHKEYQGLRTEAMAYGHLEYIWNSNNSGSPGKVYSQYFLTRSAENCFLSIQAIKFWKKHKWNEVSS